MENNCNKQLYMAQLYVPNLVNTHMKVDESVVRLEACRMGQWVVSGIPV